MKIISHDGDGKNYYHDSDSRWRQSFEKRAGHTHARA